MTFKVIKSDLFKRQEKKLPKEIKKSLNKLIQQLKKDPYIGTPITSEDEIEMKLYMIIEEFHLNNLDEAESLVMSNPSFFKTFIIKRLKISFDKF